MKNSFLLSWATALAALAITGTSVLADSVPWSYAAADLEIFNNNNPVKSSSVKFSGSSGAVSNNSGIIIYNLTSTSIATDGSPDSFSNVPFALTVTFTDPKAISSPVGHPTGIVTFNGKFNATNVTSKSLLPGVVSWVSPMTTWIDLGANDVGYHDFEIKLTSFTSPGQPGGGAGSIQLVVMVGPPTATPEPASLVLACLAIPAIVFVRRRRKKDSEPTRR